MAKKSKDGNKTPTKKKSKSEKPNKGKQKKVAKGKSQSKSRRTNSRDKNKKDNKRTLGRKYLKMEDFEKETVRLNFSNYLRFSHCVLDYQLKENILKENEYKGPSKKSKSKVFQRLNAKKGASAQNRALKDNERNAMLEGINLKMKNLLKLPHRRCSEIVSKRTKMNLKPDPIDHYFMKMLLPKRQKHKTKIGKTKNNSAKKSDRVFLIENLYLDRYQIDLGKPGQSLLALDVDEDFFYEKRSSFNPQTLKKEKGSEWAKSRIEKNLKPKTLFALTKVNNIGNLLKKIEKKISKGLDLKSDSRQVQFGKENYWDVFSADKKYLLEYKKYHQKSVEKKVIGRKLQEKMKYAGEYLIKRKANEFVEQIHQQQNSNIEI